MKITLLFAGIILAAMLFAGCQDEAPVQATIPSSDDPAALAAIAMIDAEIAGFNNDRGNAGGVGNRNFIGILSAGEEVPPTASHGRGVAKFQVEKSGTAISYKLIVANISNVIGADIHRGGRGENGPAVFELYGAAPGGGRINGPIAKGSFSPEDLTGPYAGSTDFSMFLADLHADSLYVNVRTSDGVDSTNGGRGDYNDGEIRGQLRGHKPMGIGPKDGKQQRDVFPGPPGGETPVTEKGRGNKGKP